MVMCSMTFFRHVWPYFRSCAKDNVSGSLEESKLEEASSIEKKGILCTDGISVDDGRFQERPYNPKLDT